MGELTPLPLLTKVTTLPDDRQLCELTEDCPVVSGSWRLCGVFVVSLGVRPCCDSHEEPVAQGLGGTAQSPLGVVGVVVDTPSKVGQRHCLVTRLSGVSATN